MDRIWKFLGSGKQYNYPSSSQETDTTSNETSERKRCFDRASRTETPKSGYVFSAANTDPNPSKRFRFSHHRPSSEPSGNWLSDLVGDLPGLSLSSFGKLAQRFVKLPEQADTVLLRNTIYLQPQHRSADTRVRTMNNGSRRSARPTSSLSDRSIGNGNVRQRTPPPPLIDLTLSSSGRDDGFVEYQEDASAPAEHLPLRTRTANSNGDSFAEVVTDDDDDVFEIPQASAAFSASFPRRFAERLSPSSSGLQRPSSDDDVQVIVDPSSSDFQNGDNEVQYLAEYSPPKHHFDRHSLRRWDRQSTPGSASQLHQRGGSRPVLTEHFGQAASPSFPDPSRYLTPSAGTSHSATSRTNAVNLDERDRFSELLKAVDAGSAGYRHTQAPSTSSVYKFSGHRQNRSPRKSAMDDGSLQRKLVSSRMLLDDLTEAAAQSNVVEKDGDIDTIERASTSRVVNGSERPKPAIDAKRLAELNQRFSRSPADLCKDIYEEFMPGSTRRKSEAERLEIEAKLRADARRERDRQRDIEDELKLRMRLEGLILPEPEEEAKEFPELSDEQNELIDSVLDCGADNDIVADSFGIQMGRKDVRTLRGLQWLNDEVIAFYMQLIVERSKSDNDLPTVYAFNTFFYPKLMKEGHKGLKRWTRKVDLFAHDLILVPVHLAVHWCLAIVDVRKKRISYYDSMGGANYDCLNALREYLRLESIEKKKPVDTDEWDAICVEDIPRQQNGSDCGMFACKFAEYVSRDAPITFTQENMPYFRRRMLYEIVTKALL